VEIVAHLVERALDPVGTESDLGDIFQSGKNAVSLQHKQIAIKRQDDAGQMDIGPDIPGPPERDYRSCWLALL